MTPQPLPGVAATDASKSDRAPTVSSNPYELFFSSEREPTQRMFVAKRGTPDGMFVMPIPFIAEMNGQSDGAITSIGTDLYFLDSSNQPGAARRPSSEASWGPGVLSLPSMGPADFGAGDLRLMAGSTPDRSAASSRIVEFSRASFDDMWSSAKAPKFSAGAFGDTAPTLSQDGLELFYERHPMPGLSEIYRAQRANLDEPFESSELEDLMPGMVLGDPELSWDGRTLYFTVLIGAGYRIYAATREPM
jgi:hypothetical protein